VRAVCVDTGDNHTKMAHGFCRTRLARRVWTIKGRGGTGMPVWPRRLTRSNKSKISLFIFSVDAVKGAVYARLKPTECAAGTINFPRWLDAEYFRQITAERVVTRLERGRHGGLAQGRSADGEARLRVRHAVGVGGANITIDDTAIVATMNLLQMGRRMKALSAREAKYNFGRLMDTARAEPVVIEKHGRPVVVVIAVEEYEKLTGNAVPPSRDKNTALNGD
jgi:prevent-host-death family protein